MFIFQVQLEFMLLDWDRVTKNEVGENFMLSSDSNFHFGKKRNIKMINQVIRLI